MPAGRYLEFTVKYEEMRMGCSREYLDKMVNSCLECFTPAQAGKSAGIIDLNKLQRNIIELRARLDIAPIGEDVYAYLSVMFFPLNEDITRYDPIFNRAKIDRWRSVPIPSFFSQKPINALTPFKGQSEQDIESYLLNQELTLTMMRSAFTNTSRAD